MLLRILYISWLIPLVLNGLNGQSFLNELKTHELNNDVDSQYIIIENYEEQFQSQSQWDSLLLVLNKKGQLDVRTKGFNTAMDLFNRGEKIAQEHGLLQHPSFFHLLLSKTRCMMELGKYEEASSVYEYIISQSNQTKDTFGFEGKAMINNAFSYLYRNKINKAQEIAINTEAVAKKSKDTFSLIQVYTLLTQTYSYKNNTAKTLIYAKKNMQLAEDKFNPTHPNIGISRKLLANAYFRNGEYSLALKTFKSAISVLYNEFVSSKQGVYLANTLADLGLIYSELGEYQLAEEQFEYALELAKMDYAKYDYNLLWYYEALAETALFSKRFEQAQQFIDTSFLIVAKNSQSPEYDNNFILGYQAEHDYHNKDYHSSLKNALKLYDYTIKEGSNYTRNGISISSLIAKNYMKLKDFDNTKHWLNRSIQLLDSFYTKKHPGITQGLIDLLEYNILIDDSIGVQNTVHRIYDHKNNGKTKRSIENCLPDANLIDFAALYTDYLYNRIKKSKIESIVYFDFLNEFENYYDLHLSSIRSGNTISANSKLLRKIYAPSLIMSSKNNHDEMLHYAEKLKNFETRLNLQNQLVNRDSTKSMLALQGSLQALQDSNKYKVFIDATNALDEFQSFKDSLFKNDKKSYIKRFGFNTISLDTIKNNLNQGEWLLEYLKVDSMMYIIAYDGSDIISKSISYLQLDSLLINYLNNRARDLSHQLFDILIPEEVAKTHKLLIVPDGKLFYLNFEELIDDNHQYLIQTKTIRYAYSASVLSYQSMLTQRNTPTKNILALSPGFTSNLKDSYRKDTSLIEKDTSWSYFLQQPFLLNLANTIATYSNSNSYTNLNATESKYNELAGQYKIIHLGTHGLLNNESPLFSKLILAKDEKQDGHLHTYEIYGKNIIAKLAVLSACNTGANSELDAEGITSMAHAFTHAGCPAVLMTLWEVDEKSTASILEKFYDYLLKGQKKSEALKNAKMDFLKEMPPMMHDPYYWAGLVLIGDDSPIFNESNINYIYWLITVFILLIILGVYYFRRR